MSGARSAETGARSAAENAQYSWARSGNGLVAPLLLGRAVLAVSGPQRQKFLHNLLSNEVAALTPGQDRLAALLDVKGHLIAWMRVLVTKDTVLLELPADRLALVERTLEHYRVAAPVRFARRDTAVAALVGPTASATLLRAGATLPPLEPETHADVRLDGVQALITRASDMPAGGLVLHVPLDASERVLNSLVARGARPLDRPTLDLLRVEDGCPWYGTDVSEENLLHETGLLSLYASLTKGCYVGQEVVARLQARGGHVNKMLRGLRLAEPVGAGTDVIAGAKPIGRVTTSGVSRRFGPIAMAYVHRSHFEPGALVEVAGRPATVVALPFGAAEPPHGS